MKIIYPPQTTWLDYPDNHSQAIVLYTIGCDHKCNGCQNPELQDTYYNETTTYTACDWIALKKELDFLSKKHQTNKVVFSGGDPLFSNNVNVLKKFLAKNKDFDVCIYTGYTIERVKELGINNFKFIKCNKYNKNMKQVSKKTDTYLSFASTNQELYDSNYKLLSTNGIYYF